MVFNFRRSKTDAQVPEEVQQYYQSERRERAGVAWLLALGTLIVTLIIAFALFWAGRWLYRTITDGDDKKTPEITQPVSQEQGATTGTSSTSTTTPSSGSSQTTPNTPATNALNAAGQAANTQPTTVPNTGPNETPATLVNTGPEGE